MGIVKWARHVTPVEWAMIAFSFVQLAVIVCPVVLGLFLYYEPLAPPA